MNPDEIEKLRQFIQEKEHCLPRHAGSRPFSVQLHDGTTWAGNAEVFAILRNLHADKCYALPYSENGKPMYLTVMGVAPINSVDDAVRAVLSSEAQKGSGRFASQEDESDFYAYNGLPPAQS